MPPAAGQVMPCVHLPVSLMTILKSSGSGDMARTCCILALRIAIRPLVRHVRREHIQNKHADVEAAADDEAKGDGAAGSAPALAPRSVGARLSGAAAAPAASSVRHPGTMRVRPGTNPAARRRVCYGMLMFIKCITRTPFLLQLSGKHLVFLCQTTQQLYIHAPDMFTPAERV